MAIWMILISGYVFYQLIWGILENNPQKGCKRILERCYKLLSQRRHDEFGGKKKKKPR